MKEVTFESVNQEIENLNFEALEVNLNKEALDVSSKICLIWKSVGGILRLIEKIPFLPRKWRRALRLLIDTMDSICA